MDQPGFYPPSSQQVPTNHCGKRTAYMIIANELEVKGCARQFSYTVKLFQTGMLLRALHYCYGAAWPREGHGFYVLPCIITTVVMEQNNGSGFR